MAHPHIPEFYPVYIVKMKGMHFMIPNGEYVIHYRMYSYKTFNLGVLGPIFAN